MRPAAAAVAALAALHAVPAAADPLREPAPQLARPAHGHFNAAVVAPSGIVAVGARGLAARAAGNAWRQGRVPLRRMLTAVAATADGRLLAVGHDLVVVASADSGATWSLAHSAPELDAPLMDIRINADGSGLAVGAYGLGLETADHGRSWTRRTVDPDEAHLYALRAAPDGTLFAAGEFGTVLRSRDGGRSWTRLDAGYGGTFFGLRAAADGRLLLHGLRGRLYESADGGDSWRRRETGVDAALYDLAFDAGGRAVAVGAGGTILRETPDRSAFRPVPWSGRGAIMAALPLAAGGLLIFGEDGINRIGPDAGGGR